MISISHLFVLSALISDPVPPSDKPTATVNANGDIRISFKIPKKVLKLEKELRKKFGIERKKDKKATEELANKAKQTKPAPRTILSIDMLEARIKSNEALSDENIYDLTYWFYNGDDTQVSKVSDLIASQEIKDDQIWIKIARNTPAVKTRAAMVVDSNIERMVHKSSGKILKGFYIMQTEYFDRVYFTNQSSKSLVERPLMDHALLVHYASSYGSETALPAILTNIIVSEKFETNPEDCWNKCSRRALLNYYVRVLKSTEDIESAQTIVDLYREKIQEDAYKDVDNGGNITYKFEQVLKEVKKTKFPDLQSSGSQKN